MNLNKINCLCSKTFFLEFRSWYHNIIIQTISMNLLHTVLLSLTVGVWWTQYSLNNSAEKTWHLLKILNSQLELMTDIFPPYFNMGGKSGNQRVRFLTFTCLLANCTKIDNCALSVKSTVQSEWNSNISRTKTKKSLLEKKLSFFRKKLIFLKWKKWQTCCMSRIKQ